MSGIYSVTPASEIEPAEWDELVDHSEDAWLHHRSAWLRAEAVLAPQRGFGVRIDGRLMAVCPLMTFDLPVFPGRLRCLASGGIFSSGPAFRTDMPAERRRETEDLTYARLTGLLASERLDLLVVRLPPLTPAFFRARVNPLARRGFLPQCLYGGPLYWGHAALTRIMTLEGERETWLRSASSRLRTQVRAVEREGLAVETVSYAEGWRRFRGLQEATYRRTGASVWPEAFFERLEPLRESFALHFARKEGQDAAALWVARQGIAATYLASATDYEGADARFGAALQFHAMEEARRGGCRYYQIGPYYPFMQASDKMHRIGEFKRRLGGEDWPLPEGTLVRSPFKLHSLLALHRVATGAARVLRRRG